MRLAVSNRYWDFTWDNLLKVSRENHYNGVEIDITKDEFKAKNGAFCANRIMATKREMIEAKLMVSDIYCGVDISVSAKKDENMAMVKEAVRIAKGLGVEYVRLGAKDGSVEESIEFLKEALVIAESNNIVLVIETTGLFSDTFVLRDMLNLLADDYIACDWHMYDTFNKGEDGEKSIQNLGAYVKLVHVIDADSEGNYTFLGEGVLPLKDMMNTLRSINYEGFISVEWNALWVSEVDDAEVVLTYFYNKLHQFDLATRMQRPLYYNKTRTGTFLWEKDSLIDKTFPKVLDAMVEEYPDQIAIKFTTLDYTRTYSEFRDDVDEFARALVAMGVKAGSHVAMWATNVPQWYIAFWAVTKIGAVLVTMNTAYKIHEAEYLLKQSDSHTLIMIDSYRDSNYKETMLELCPELNEVAKGKALHAKRLPFLRNIITVGFSMPGGVEWEDALNRASEVSLETVQKMADKVSINDVCNMQYTSGTTGFPKGVMLTHYNVVNDGKCIGDRMDLSTADRMMIQVPMFHCFGMVLAMTASMTHGVSLYPLPYFSPKPALNCINQEKITCFHGVPTMFIAMLGHKDFDKTDFSHMRTGIMAGSPCPTAIMQDVIDKMHMKEITIVYGQTESSPGCTMSSTDDSVEVRVNTVGYPLPGIECKIVDAETGEDCADNVIGEFVARGYNIMKGYYKMPKATASAIDKEGWLHTGDLACRTPEGNYRITGRLKDMIIRGGENIYPKEIEEFIYTHPLVEDVQVIGVPDEGLGEEIMACVVLKKGAEMTDEEMKKFVRDHMAKHKVPKYIDFVEGFPMNAAGKILKYKMRDDAIEKLGLQKAASIVTA